MRRRRGRLRRPRERPHNQGTPLPRHRPRLRAQCGRRHRKALGPAATAQQRARQRVRDGDGLADDGTHRPTHRHAPSSAEWVGECAAAAERKRRNPPTLCGRTGAECAAAAERKRRKWRKRRKGRLRHPPKFVWGGLWPHLIHSRRSHPIKCISCGGFSRGNDPTGSRWLFPMGPEICTQKKGNDFYGVEV
jgi:hypothetical protein